VSSKLGEYAERASEEREGRRERADGPVFVDVGLDRDECKQQVRDFEGAKFKGFWKREEAEEWVVEKVEEAEQRRKRR